MISSYLLSQQADDDLVEIFEYTSEHFNEDQAISYLIELERLFLLIVANPNIGKERNEIRPKLRSISKNSHVVFYKVDEDLIRIVRVLHASRDISNFKD